MEIVAATNNAGKLKELRRILEPMGYTPVSYTHLLSEERERMSGEMARLAERKAAAETEYDQTVAKLWEEYQLTPGDAAGLCVEFDSAAELRRLVAEVRAKIRALGNVNVGAIEEFREVSESYNTLKTDVYKRQHGGLPVQRKNCDEGRPEPPPAGHCRPGGHPAAGAEGLRGGH